MSLFLITQLLAGAGLIFAVLSFASRLRAFSGLARPLDRSTPKGDPKLGIAYAFTLGMAPWAKESTRRHALAYLRGVGFHLGIFLGLGVLLISPWMAQLPVNLRQLLAILTGTGALLGLVGFTARLIEPNLKVLSTPDDYTAVFLVSLFLATASLALLSPDLCPLFWSASAVMLVYAPMSKIRHCIYFAYSRLFFGKFVGSRGVLPHSQQPGR
jgi:hypothetical protein